ncbi:MAG: hypothetical protein DWQ19_12335 [Crenarchaeota archaeon]|nr:MAG: hypothetical protein DWQ19_12335 [Thermoproteota archaeon]
MKSWDEYFKYRENDEEGLNPVDKGEESALYHMTRLAWKNHRDDVVHLFKRLAATDPEIAAEYERLGDVEELPSKKKMIDKDEIYPPSADTGVGLDGD